jgi:hypothetical protein
LDLYGLADFSIESKHDFSVEIDDQNLIIYTDSETDLGMHTIDLVAHLDELDPVEF